MCITIAEGISPHASSIGHYQHEQSLYLTTMLACWPPQKYALDTTQLAVIELAVVGLLEAKRYEGYKKTGEVSFHN